MGSSKPAPQILFADDEDEFGLVLERWLREHGYDCVRVSDTAGAIQALERRDFDLVLSDIEMPGSGGLALAKHVESRGDGLPVILLTGRPSFETAMNAVGSSVVAYLVKPFDDSELARRIEDALALGEERRARARRARCLGESLGLLESFELRLRDGASEGALRIELAGLLRTLTEETPSGAPAGPDSEEARIRLLEAALRDTVAILEDTRKAFKSKQLGDLRKRLEQLPGLH